MGVGVEHVPRYHIECDVCGYRIEHEETVTEAAVMAAQNGWGARLQNQDELMSTTNAVKTTSKWFCPDHRPE